MIGADSVLWIVIDCRLCLFNLFGIVKNHVYYQALLVQLNNFVAVHEYCTLYKRDRSCLNMIYQVYS